MAFVRELKERMIEGIKTSGYASIYLISLSQALLTYMFLNTVFLFPLLFLLIPFFLLRHSQLQKGTFSIFLIMLNIFS